jgi:membrane-bound serine protease (ClpP class)
MIARFFFLLLIFSSLFSQDISADLEKHIKYIPDQENLIGYISIEKNRPIDQSTFIEVKFALDHFREKNVRFVLLNLNTPGGEVFAALKICRLLQEFDTEFGIPIVAFIDNWAISAGAMLAYSSRFIGTTPQSSMGAAEPVNMTQEGAKTASEKVNSYLRSEFANLARFYNRNPLIAQAMVDKSLIVVKRGGEILKLEDEKEIRSSDQIISGEGKLLTLDAKQLVDLGISDFSVPFQKSLSLEGEQTIAFSNSALFSDPFFSKMENAKLISYKDWRVSFFSFLSLPIISSLLVIGLILGLYMEMSTPGFGVFGTVGLICLGLVLLSSFSIYAVNWIEVILLAVGLVLLLLEIFVIPGFGVAGILGTLLFLGGLAGLMLPGIKNAKFSLNPDGLNLEALDVLRHFGWFSLAFLVAFILILLLSKYVMPRLFMISPLVSRGSQDKTEGYSAGPKLANMPKVGSKGVVYSSLRPSGKVMIEEDIYDAIAESGYIDKDENIEIIAIKAKRLIVRRIE